VTGNARICAVTAAWAGERSARTRVERPVLSRVAAVAFFASLALLGTLLLLEGYYDGNRSPGQSPERKGNPAKVIVRKQVI